jgi:hypothetical protein
MRFGLTKLRQHSSRRSVTGSNNYKSKKSDANGKKSKTEKLSEQHQHQHQHQLFDSDGEVEPGSRVIDVVRIVAVGDQAPVAAVNHNNIINNKNERHSVVNHKDKQVAAVSLSSTTQQHTPVNAAPSVSTTDQKSAEFKTPPSPVVSSTAPPSSPARSSTTKAARALSPKPLPRHTRSVKQRAFRERLHSLSRDLIQESPTVAAAATAAAVVTPGSLDATITTTAAATIATTTTTTKYTMMEPASSPRAAAEIFTTPTTSTATSPATVPSSRSELYSLSSAVDVDGHDGDDDDDSTEFEISQSYNTRPPQPQTATTAFDILDGHSDYQAQQQQRDLRSPQETVHTEGSTSTSLSHVVSMATTKTNGDDTFTAASLYTFQTNTVMTYVDVDATDAESHKSSNSHSWIDALTWSWGRNPCIVLEELMEMWDPEEPPTANIKSNKKDKARNGAGGGAAAAAAAAGGVSGGSWFKWSAPKWHIVSHGEEMRFSDCTNSVIRSSDQDSSSKSKPHHRRVVSSSSTPRVGSAAAAARASSVLFSKLAACQTSSTASTTPSQEGFERQVSAHKAQQQQQQQQAREEEGVVGPSYAEEEGGVTVPAQVVALRKDVAQQKDEEERRNSAGGAGAVDRGLRMSPSDASTITSTFSVHYGDL